MAALVAMTTILAMGVAGVSTASAAEPKEFNAGSTESVSSARARAQGVPVSQSNGLSKLPVYRVYNPNSGLHHYTVNAGERDSLVKLGWRNEGTSFNGATGQGAVPVYREYNPNDGNHNWTMNKVEHDHLVSIGWRNEGVAWHVALSASTNVYRLYNPTPFKTVNGRGNGGSEHVYTTNYAEYLSVQKAGWRGEGVAWKSL